MKCGYHGFKAPSLRPGACETKMTSSSSLSLLEMIHVVFLICRRSFFRNLLSAVSRMIWIWADLIKVIHRSGTCRLTSLSCKIALSTLDVTVPRCFQNIFCCTPDLDGREGIASNIVMAFSDPKISQSLSKQFILVTSPRAQSVSEWNSSPKTFQTTSFQQHLQKRSCLGIRSYLPVSTSSEWEDNIHR